MVATLRMKNENFRYIVQCKIHSSFFILHFYSNGFKTSFRGSDFVISTFDYKIKTTDYVIKNFPRSFFPTFSIFYCNSRRLCLILS